MSVAASTMVIPWAETSPIPLRRPKSLVLLKARWRENAPSPSEGWNEPQNSDWSEQGGGGTCSGDGWGTGHFSSGTICAAPVWKQTRWTPTLPLIYTFIPIVVYSRMFCLCCVHSMSVYFVFPNFRQRPPIASIGAFENGNFTKAEDRVGVLETGP